MLSVAGLKLSIVVMVGGLGVAPAVAGTYTTLYQFKGGSDGWAPPSSPTYDEKGDLYGVAAAGGTCSTSAYGCGTVYKLSSSGQETPLVTFNGIDGDVPQAPLTLVDHKLYGSTLEGGNDGQGVLFSVHTNGTHFRLLHQFRGTDGDQPRAPLIPGPDGALYGITLAGGPNPKNENGGVLFELMPDGTYIQLHDFTGRADGGRPNALIIDASGTLYGSTTYGSPCAGEQSCGVVFKYVPSTATFSVLHQFAKADGIVPMLGSIGLDGTLYGATAQGGGGASQGSLFELVPTGGTYIITTLYRFLESHGPGEQPSGGPILTPYGDLIGTTTVNPTLYRFKDNKIKVLYAFPTPSYPEPPIMAKDGTIYGVSPSGGVSPCDGLEYSSCGYIYGFLQ